MRLTFFLAVAVGIPAFAAAQLTISRPPNDTVVNGSKADVSGTGVPNGTKVSVTVNKVTKSGTAAGGNWTVSGVSLAKGDNVVRAQAGTATARSLAVRSSPLSSQGVQRVFFLWDPAVDEELRKIARGTLTPTPTDTQLDTFVTRVRARTQQIYAERYQPFGVQLVTTSGLGVHTVRLRAISNSSFGHSPGDCGSDTPEQISIVHVGTYRRGMVNQFSGWRPMLRTDNLETRIEDVSQALGRTSTHETGHSLGLTVCSWMRGCNGGHNCQSYDVNQPLANRFDHGRHIMDPGPKTFNRFRIAEPNEDSRAATRRPSIWEPFGRSYLDIVHPGGSP